MATLFLFLLFLIGIILLWCRKLCAARWLLSISIILFWLDGTGIPAKLALNTLQQYDVAKPQFQSRNAIIVLGGGTAQPPSPQLAQPSILSYSRIMEGARLYFLCKNKNKICKIIVSGGDPLRVGKTESEVYKWKLINLHIPADDVLTEMKSFNTYQNAKFTKSIVDENKFDNLILVTSNLHMTRALKHFAQFDMKATAAPSDYIAVKPSWLPSSYHLALLDFAVHEYAGMVRIKVYDAMGWNKR